MSRRSAAPRGSSVSNSTLLPRSLFVAVLLVLVLAAAIAAWLFLKPKASPHPERGGTASPAKVVPGRSHAASPSAVAGGGQDANAPSTSSTSSNAAAPTETVTGPANLHSSPEAGGLPKPPESSTSPPESEAGQTSSESAPPAAGAAGSPALDSGPAESGNAKSGLATAGTGSQAQQAVTPPPVPAIPLASPERRPAPAPGEDLILRVIPFQPVRFSLMCGGKELFSGNLSVGSPLRFQCPGVYEVSLDDAGAVSLSVNGERIYLGRPGQSIAGRHVSAANYLDFARPPSEAIPR